MWLHSQWLQRLGGGWGEQFAVEVIARLHFIFLSAHKDKEVVKLLKRVRRERKCLLTGFEQFLVYSLARSQCHLDGDLAEVGVYTGASAKLIAEARDHSVQSPKSKVQGQTHNGEPAPTLDLGPGTLDCKCLHLFDTFAGLPESSAKDRNVYTGKSKPQYACSLGSVQEYLRNYANLQFYKGLFPNTAAPAADRNFCFVHIDVDLYTSTLACLEFFYPRLVPGGILLSHDYSLLTGVKAAFTEFLADKTEAVVELPTTQAMIIKR
jgi:O-methyltransferase